MACLAFCLAASNSDIEAKLGCRQRAARKSFPVGGLH